MVAWVLCGLLSSYTRAAMGGGRSCMTGAGGEVNGRSRLLQSTAGV